MQCLQKTKGILADRTALAFFKISAVWIPGLVLGYFLARGICQDLGVYLGVAVSVRSSLIGAVISSSATVILSALLARFLHWRCVYIVAFLEAVVFACISCCCVWNFSSAGWLIRLLLLFSSCCAVFVLLYFWVHVITRREAHSRIALFAISITVVIGFLDYLVISPFLASLFD